MAVTYCVTPVDCRGWGSIVMTDTDMAVLVALAGRMGPVSKAVDRMSVVGMVDRTSAFGRISRITLAQS